MSQLEDIKAQAKGRTPGPWAVLKGENAEVVISANRLPITWDDHGGEVFRNRADAELIAAAPKLLAALEAVEEVIAEHESRTAWPDADKADKAYSLGKRHAYDRVRYEITEALA